MTYTLGKGKKYFSNIFGALAIFGTLACTTTAFLNPIVYAANDNIDVNLNVGSVISIYAKNKVVNLSGNVDSFVSAPLDIYVSTNSIFGYTLDLSAIGTKTDMTSTTTTETLTSNFTDTKTSSTMLDNTWGFSLDNTNYKNVPVEAKATKIRATSVPSMEPNYSTNTVYFGAKIGRLLPAGEYSDDVRFTAYVNAVEPEPEMQAMQEFSCSELANIGDSIDLIDIRDKTIYKVKKLGDGNCWMTSNLKIKGKVLTSADSDVTSSFVLPDSNLSTFGVNMDQVSVYSEPTYGGLYSFAAATANSGATTSMTKGTAPESICPKGWTIPTSAQHVALANVYDNDYTKYAAATNISLSGIVIGSDVLSIEKIGFYWTSTAMSSYYAGNLYITNDKNITPLLVQPDSGYQRNYGLAVRCIAR